MLKPTGTLLSDGGKRPGISIRRPTSLLGRTRRARVALASLRKDLDAMQTAQAEDAPTPTNWRRLEDDWDPEEDDFDEKANIEEALEEDRGLLGTDAQEEIDLVKIKAEDQGWTEATDQN